jgi:hypothetical protein
VGIGLLVGSLFGGVAVAKIVIPAHSVGWNSLTKGLQKRINHAKSPGPVGPKGDRGATGPQGPAGKVSEAPGQPEFSMPYIRTLSVSSVTGDGATLEADIGTDGAEDGIYYQFQVVKDPDDFRPEVSCPARENRPPVIQCLGALLDGGIANFGRRPGDLPTRDLLPVDGDRHVRLEVHGLDRETEYHYRFMAVERVQGVDTINWKSGPVSTPEQTFTTADFYSPRAYGWVAPFDENEEFLKRSHNAYLEEPDGNPTGIWCIVPESIDPSKAIVQLTPVEEPHVAPEVIEPEVPVVRWQTSPIHCDEDEIEVETALYKGGDQDVPADIPFTFVIEEAG